ncbi:MAG: TonB-dependent siderophore receptor [Steroidobacteraceae bacterium]
MNRRHVKNDRRRRAGLASSAALFLAVLQSAPVFAQAPPPAEVRVIDLEEVVVTGTARSVGVSKFDASFAITTVDSEQIREIAPLSTADLFKVTPGVWAESSSGESGANVMVRGFAVAGDAEYATVQYAGSPIYPPSTLSFLENSTLFRLDETIDHVEALRGGPNPVFSNGQTGVTFNFIPKKGTETPEGLVKVGVSDYGQLRTDVYYGGPLAQDWYVALGGFYRTSDGIRDSQFPADQGGQFSVNLTRELDNGEASFYVRRTDDSNLFITGIPLLGSESGKVREFPGFDAGDGFYAGNDTRLAVLEVEAADSPGGQPGTTRVDLGDGRGVDVVLTGGSFDVELNDVWTFGAKFNYLKGDANTRALFNQGSPVSIEDFITDTITRANGSPYVTNAAGLATAGTATFAANSDPVPAGQQVLAVGWWSVDKALESFSTDLRLSAQIGVHTPTLGLYYADYSSRDLWYLGNNMVLAAEPNSRLVNIALDNGVQVTRDGFGGPAPGAGVPFFDVNASYNGRNVALFLADEVLVTDQMRIDVGVRYEDYDVNASIENSVGPPGGDFDGDPFTYYNNGGAVLGGSFRALDFQADEFSYTAGMNYAFTDSLAMFLRFNSGHRFPFFDGLRDGIEDIVDIDQYEVGLKAAGESWGVYATAFYLELRGQNLQAFRDVDGDGVNENVNEAAGGDSYGLEIEAELVPVDNLALTLSATLQNAELVDVGDFTGNQVPRQPELQARFTPSYSFDVPWGSLKLYSTLTHVDERFQDTGNLQPLPSYEKVDAGVSIDIGENFNVLVVGDNLTDEIGITEGNPRVTGTGVVNNVVIARPIQGRSYVASVTYRF